MKLEEFRKTLDTGEIGDNFAYCDCGYIDEIISDIADQEISIYTSDQIEFAFDSDNEDWVKEALWNGLALGGKDYFDANPRDDFHDYAAHIGIAAWYEKNRSDLYEHLTENVRLSVCEALEAAGIDELTDEQVSAIECLEIDSNDRLEDVIAEAMAIFKTEEAAA